MRKRWICLLALWLCVSAAAPALAAADGAYLAATNTHYLNPDTGRTDDGGTQNAALGEGMCRSVVYEKALVEIRDGRSFVTVRLQLMSNMRECALSVQREPGGAYTAVTPTVMQEDAARDTADYRFEVPAVDSYLSWEMYVIPMGRSVKFYMNLDTALTEGTGDFLAPRPAGAGAPAAETETPGGETPEPEPPASLPPAAEPADTPDHAAADGTAPETPPAATPAPHVPPVDGLPGAGAGASAAPASDDAVPPAETPGGGEPAGQPGAADEPAPTSGDGISAGAEPAGAPPTDGAADAPGAETPDAPVPAAAPEETGAGPLTFVLAAAVPAVLVAASILLRKARRIR
ncbi:MAG: hypothetical protein LBH86_05565 [Oscillospiraceae bacterium]|jgi:hypothetical protein|nr:hypothetical protein [Oscillospiraceae bacterium]